MCGSGLSGASSGAMAGGGAWDGGDADWAGGAPGEYGGMGDFGDMGDGYDDGDSTGAVDGGRSDPGDLADIVEGLGIGAVDEYTDGKDDAGGGGHPSSSGGDYLASPDPWACSECTYANAGDSFTCVMCGEPNPDLRKQQRARGAGGDGGPGDGEAEDADSGGAFAAGRCALAASPRAGCCHSCHLTTCV